MDSTRFKTRSIEFDLSPVSIDETSEWLYQSQLQLGVDKDNRLRTRLLFEEVLLNFADHFGDEQKAAAYLENSLGRHRLRLVVEGEKFNPMKHSEDDMDDFSMSLFSSLDMRTQYSYAMGANIIRIPTPRPSINPAIKIFIAIVIAILVGVLGNFLIPDHIQKSITDAVFDPIANMWVRVLQAVSGPIIFFTTFTAALNTKRISDYGGSRIKTIARYFGIIAMMAVFVIFCSYLILRFDTSFSSINSETLPEIFAGILELVPGNLIEPFITVNTPQLLLIALVAGYALGAMGNQVTELKEIIRQVNRLGLVIARQVCLLVPFFVGLLLCLKIWTHNTDMLVWVWAPLISAIGLSGIIFISTLLIVSARVHVAPRVLSRKLSGPFREALRVGSLDYSSVEKLADTCKRSLGIDSSFAEAVLPQGLVLYMPISAIGITVFVLFAARLQLLDVNLLWLLVAGSLAVVLAVATPPVSGANLLAFVVAFSYLGISPDAILDVMVFDILFGVICIALDQSMLQLDTILQASEMGFLDEEILRSE